MADTGPLVDVSLVLYGEKLDPETASKMLGIKGSRMRIKGGKWRTSTDHEITAKIGLWKLQAERKSMELHDQIASLRKQLDAPFALSQIPDVQFAKIDVFIALASNDRGGGDYECRLTSDDLVWISSLGVSLDFTLAYTLKSDQGGDVAKSVTRNNRRRNAKT